MSAATLHRASHPPERLQPAACRVGNVTEATPERVIIDHWFFGVAAVDRDGNESLVVFPAPGRQANRGG